MKILIQNGRVIDPARGFDQVCDVALAAGRVVAVGQAPAGFEADRVVDASGQWVLPGLVDLAVRLREPGYEHEGMLASEMGASVAGGVTSLVCLPDTDPVLDEQGLVEMLKFRAEKLHQSRLFPMGALTVGLKGETLTEMAELTESGCVAFGQADVPLASITTLSRALAYANTFGYAVWLRPQDKDLGKGVAASGPLATRMGLSGVSVAAETIALHTIFELIRGSQTRVHLCRLSSAAGVELVRKAKAEGLNVTADVSINSLHLTENDIGYFDSSARLVPPLRQQRDRDALSAALADGTIDALVSDHCPVDEDAKVLPFAEAEPGATGVELLLALAVKWSQDQNVPLVRALEVVTAAPARVLGGALGTLQASLGQLVDGGVADLCVVNPQAAWTVGASELASQGKSTPFNGYELPARVQLTVVGGHIAFERA
ncbi:MULTISPECIES: dihydroorotase [Comamonas]|jgi:dihydroorotase|uniref:Dihydroorotase n=1 Tax=Comamonas terrigena TaxID=32013 RepID=A0A2A7UTE0_COMTR|nr:MULTISPECIES: dihydroorotase [Comamonas]MBD9532295.1 dihydroorotase [Comamonas sp. CMM01]MBV7418487.1 dihydroorotase [Comamonas sp. CMM03]MDH0048189.1 dihydroorotase [Comamonas terrigena]MDH0510597.1 dihydroorotase [Comamonas terrigena]MDH1090496.1 dihydroorotase [Comamonas terrigena]